MTHFNSESVPRNYKSYVLRVLFIALSLVAWFSTQSFLGARQYNFTKQEIHISSEVISGGDGLIEWSEPVHQWMVSKRSRVNTLLISSSALIDLLGLFLFLWSVFGPSMRPFVGLLVLFILRQFAQSLCALPPPANMIWEDPGFPSLLVTYKVANDFFFSGHTAIAVYGALELCRFRNLFIKILAVCIGLFLISSVILLRAHYTMDVFTGLLAAFLAFQFASNLATPCDQLITKLTA